MVDKTIFALEPANLHLEMIPSQVVLCILLSSAVVGGRADCPTWFMDDGNSTVKCTKCGPSLNGAISCDSHSKLIRTRIGWCMTAMENDLGSGNNRSSDIQANWTLVAGRCPYFHPYNTTEGVYFKVPSDPAEVDYSMCSYYHRQGLLCGQCLEGFGPAVYSFDLHCSNCSDLHTATAVSLYILLEVVPITIFFFVLVIFRLNIMFGPMFGYIIFCQYYVVAIRSYKITYDSLLAFLPSPLVTLTRISTTISAVWNLLFFRFVIPPFCISSNITGIHVHMLGFVTALIPICLVFLTYAGLELNVKKLPGVWYLCHLLHKMYCPDFSLSDSVVHAFATFILMSMTLVTYETQTMVSGVDLYDVHGNSIGRRMYTDPTITMYSGPHLPFLCFALLLMFILVLCPAVVLIVYPTSLYQTFTQCISSRTQISIKIFVETFQGTFKDGLHGTRDYRMLPGLAILTCFIYYIIVQSLYNVGISLSSTSNLTLCVFVIVLALAVSWAKPCKTTAGNASLTFHLMLLGIWSMLSELWVGVTFISSEYLALSLTLIPAVPHVLMLVWVLYKLTTLWLYHYYGLEAATPGEVLKSICKIITCRSMDNDCSCLNRRRNRSNYDLLES